MFSCVTASNRQSFFWLTKVMEMPHATDISLLDGCVVELSLQKNCTHLRLITRVFLTPVVTANSQVLTEKKNPRYVSSDVIFLRTVVARL